ncbi:CopG family transcriptional regulator [Candidatus Leptofilum sp.]|uniref:CopG family transcriptional regulator n=1 Tax=Candidatus Leptofilum sp. TaxID=3241576 RepID=UPI003B5B096C
MADSEKITINMSVVDLGKVDLLVEEGFYSNRTDFIRTGIRNLLDKHADEVKQSVTRKTMAVGVVGYGRTYLEERRVAGEKVSAWVVGSLIIESDVSVELALDTIESIKVYGVLKASDKVKNALLSRIL